MWYRMAVLGSVLALTGALGLADDTADRAKLSGKWEAKPGEKADFGTVTLQDDNGTMRIIEESNGQKIAEYECNTMGRECAVKEGGHATKVSMWFNGSKLVEMRTRGSEVVKRRFQVNDAGLLELEVIPIAPAGKAEVIHLGRLQSAADRKSQ